MLFVLKRLGQAIITLFIVSLMIWSLMALVPGDPAQRILQARGILDPSPVQVAALTKELGLNQSWPVRYGSWLYHLIQGDLGISWSTGRAISAEFLHRMPATVILTLISLLIAIMLSVILGIPAAIWNDRLPDKISRYFTLVALSAPSFLIGVVFLEVVTLRIGLGKVLADGTINTVLPPAIVLAIGPAASWSRLLRTSLLETKSDTFLAVAKGRGATTWFLLTRHLLPHSVPPLLTVIGLSAAALLGGAPVVETVFSWPGIGLYTVQAIENRDLPVVAAATLFAVSLYIIISTITDLILVKLDPRKQITS